MIPYMHTNTDVEQECHKGTILMEIYLFKQLWGWNPVWIHRCPAC
uniref:Uncharacterized protein n=1 Tax=Rhizophora mucronata TaxID=61149 RepID=A0A2P2IUG8_RHIMU